ncbi:MAG: RNase adapter RapZ [Acidimicrobiia bacterium]|nr:RNase adapter RapZ [Actinomycetota bacterium]NDB05929.1 RNase adapter RapZ [Acidimicrobiia bacterium]NDA76936.1 RNase adapter RapZ [Actinomycetota bacterium]NDD96244.1 RNase adapter RapZ [Actinomycetota bacterium]NDE58203.1 RNase adapter RapZ [Acidimicrobiia bacterium]
MADILVITGLSGAGRSATAAVLEDLDWYVVDNLPTSLVDTIVELASAPGSGIDKLALVAGRQHLELMPKVARMRSEGHRVRIVYLDASTRELVKRYEASRRRHPLAAEADGLVESIELERTLLEPMKGDCDLVIDTTELNTNQLKTKLLGLFEDPVRERLQITVESFGFKHGLPLDADMVLDVRFLPNPHWDESLRPMSGLDRPVRDFVLGEPDAENFVVKLVELLAMIVPLYANEGKSYLTIAVGCTGGRHRSVAIATEIAERMRASGQPVRVGHRDIGR